MAEEKEPKEDVEEEEEESIEEEVKAIFKDVKEEVKKDLEMKLEEMVEAEKEKKDKKLGAYAKEEDNKEKNKRFVKALQDVVRGEKINPKFETKDHSTSDVSEVVDDEISFEIRYAVEQYGMARELFRNHTLSKNSYKANELSTDVSAYWVDEEGKIDATNFTVTQNTLSLEKLAAIVLISNELLEDSEINLQSFLIQRIGEVFAQEEDEVFFAGDSNASDPVDGLLELSDLETSSMDVGDTAASDLDADYLLDMQEEVPNSVRQNGVYLMSFSVFNIVRKLKDNDGSYIYQSISEDGPGTIWGKPVMISDAMPSASDVSAEDYFVIFGDFERGTVLGSKGGIRVDSTGAAIVEDTGSNDVNTFRTDQQAIRFIERVGYCHVLSNTLVKLQAGATS